MGREEHLGHYTMVQLLRLLRDTQREFDVGRATALDSIRNALEDLER